MIQTLKHLRSQLPSLQRRELKETPTRTILIDPILQALGWDVRDPDEVELEYPTCDGKSVDYALKINEKAVDERVLALRDAYVSAGILTARWADDAAHVAAATVADADLIVSWNFRHIVHFDKIRLYNAVNAMNGYRPVDIRSPLEVIDYEKEDF